MAMDRERPRGRKRRKVCSFCVDKVEHIDYKMCIRDRGQEAAPFLILPLHTHLPFLRPVRSTESRR